jgi:DNA-binding MarR family transcriptional regulator
VKEGKMIATKAPSTEILDSTIDKFWETIPSLWHIIRARIRDEAVSQFDITVEQFHILRRINKGRNSVSKLAEAKHISRPAISRAVDVMVNKNLVTRTQNTQDRRYIELDLTPKGHELLEVIFGKNRQWMLQKLSSLEEIELMRIQEALNVLGKAFM